MFAILRSKELDFRCPLFKFEVASCEGSIMEEEKIFEKRWELASVEQRARYHNLMSSYRNIDWTYKEKKYLLWLCQLDVNTFETFEVILDKIKNSNEKRLFVK